MQSDVRARAGKQHTLATRRVRQSGRMKKGIQMGGCDADGDASDASTLGSGHEVGTLGT